MLWNLNEANNGRIESSKEFRSENEALAELQALSSFFGTPIIKRSVSTLSGRTFSVEKATTTCCPNVPGAVCTIKWATCKSCPKGAIDEDN